MIISIQWKKIGQKKWQKKELEEREKCDFNLYVIEDLSLYSIAEVVDDSNKRPKKTFLLFFESKFNNKHLKAIQHIEEMVRNNGSYIIKDFNELINYLNNLKYKTFFSRRRVFVFLH